MNKNTYDISSIKRVTRKFLEVSSCSRAKQRQRNVQKSVLHVQSCFFANQTYCCFFTVLVAFAAQQNMILYFVGANYKYYRELRFQPWLKLYIITERKETANSLIGICIVSSLFIIHLPVSSCSLFLLQYVQNNGVILSCGIRTFRTHGRFEPRRFVPKVEMIRTQR